MTLGEWAELEAIEILTRAGFKILAHNFHSRYGEIDIIACRDLDLVFIEVKARAKTSHGQAFEVVTPSKQLKIVKTALKFVEKYPNFYDYYYRFDVICFDFLQEFSKKIQYDFSKITYHQQWIENAFTLDIDLINL